MIDKEEKPFFSFVCETEEDIKLEINKQISELLESQQSEFKFNNETLYKLGNGHSFCYGFFTQYLTKTGVSARVDWFLSGDDGEESFIERLAEDLKAIETQI